MSKRGTVLIFVLIITAWITMLLTVAWKSSCHLMEIARDRLRQCKRERVVDF